LQHDMARAVPLIDGLERRAGTELRVAAGRRLEGYAARFDSPALINNQFTETIKPGAFRSTLLAPGCDVLALLDHDVTRLLARTASGTLRLAEDARGLRFDLDVPQTTLGNDVLALAARGDLGGMSFGFRPTDEAWPTRDRRELRSVDLVEVSVVQAFPAYAGTSVAARARPFATAVADARARRRFMASL
jgi:uncharacterized protein